MDIEVFIPVYNIIFYIMFFSNRYTYILLLLWCYKYIVLVRAFCRCLSFQQNKIKQKLLYQLICIINSVFSNNRYNTFSRLKYLLGAERIKYVKNTKTRNIKNKKYYKYMTVQFVVPYIIYLYRTNVHITYIS